MYLYWHWSPEYNWEMNFPLEGYNECLITYILAASSPTYPIPASAYHNGWARKGVLRSIGYGIWSAAYYLNITGLKHWVVLLFWAHYSYIGLNPKGLSDAYADYWEVNRNHTLINYNHCVENPGKFKGYGADCWGLTASYSVQGYNAHMPSNDLGVITPTAALSSFPYTPEESLRALKHFYLIWATVSGVNMVFMMPSASRSNWYPKRYLAIDQCTIAPMIENYRTGLLWRLFMSCPEVQQGLKKLGFTVTADKV
jgi:hypothetical protein